MRGRERRGSDIFLSPGLQCGLPKSESREEVFFARSTSTSARAGVMVLRGLMRGLRGNGGLMCDLTPYTPTSFGYCLQEGVLSGRDFIGSSTPDNNHAWFGRRQVLIFLFDNFR